MPAPLEEPVTSPEFDVAACEAATTWLRKTFAMRRSTVPFRVRPARCFWNWYAEEAVRAFLVAREEPDAPPALEEFGRWARWCLEQDLARFTPSNRETRTLEEWVRDQNLS